MTSVASSSVAIADGKWELGLANPLSTNTKPYMGWCTLVLRETPAVPDHRGRRYTVDPPANTTRPTILEARLAGRAGGE
jgi:hypothetical protein